MPFVWFFHTVQDIPAVRPHILADKCYRSNICKDPLSTLLGLNHNEWIASNTDAKMGTYSASTKITSFYTFHQSHSEWTMLHLEWSLHWSQPWRGTISSIPIQGVFCLCWYFQWWNWSLYCSGSDLKMCITRAPAGNKSSSKRMHKKCWWRCGATVTIVILFY